MTPDPPTNLSVDRAPVTGRRPLVSAVIVSAAVIVFLGTAIIKPWGSRADATNAQPPTASAPAPTGQPAFVRPAPPVSRRSSRPVAAATPLPSAPLTAELRAATVRRDAWGVSAVVVPAGTQRFDVGGPGLAERWMPIDVPAGAIWNLDLRGTAEQWGDAVLALGATLPDDALPGAVRFWRLDDDDAPRELAAVSVSGSEGGTQLWLPDPANSTSIGTWPAGMYRIDVTVGPRVVRLVMIVRGDLSTQ